jgi:UDP-glucose:(heptosyl)LPS alpha-1,3-glucosyltransferase
MRVAIVQEQVDVRRGGAETSTLEMARHLVALGVDVTVVCAESDEATERRSDEGVRFRYVPVGGGSRMGRTVRFVAEADRFCREAGFDVVHAVTPCFSCDVYQPRGGTYVETVRQSVARASNPLMRLIKRVGRRFNRRQQLLLRVERAILSGADPPYVACVSEYVRRQVESAFIGFPKERNRVVFNGVGLEPLPPVAAGHEQEATRRRLNVGEQTSVVLLVANNFKLKGLAELIGALAELPESDWVLAVVGRGEAGRYQRLVDRLPVRGRIEFFGQVEDIRSFYYGADVLAHPTWYDPCSRVVLEALVCGLPVVTTRFNGAAEAIEDGRHGAVVDSPRDVAALAAAITQCLRPEVRASCRAGAGAMAERLSMARHARELKKLYEDVLAEKMSGSG